MIPWDDFTGLQRLIVFGFIVIAGASAYIALWRKDRDIAAFLAFVAILIAGMEAF